MSAMEDSILIKLMGKLDRIHADVRSIDDRVGRIERASGIEVASDASTALAPALVPVQCWHRWQPRCR